MLPVQSSYGLLRCCLYVFDRRSRYPIPVSSRPMHSELLWELQRLLYCWMRQSNAVHYYYYYDDDGGDGDDDYDLVQALVLELLL